MNIILCFNIFAMFFRISKLKKKASMSQMIPFMVWLVPFSLPILTAVTESHAHFVPGLSGKTAANLLSSKPHGEDTRRVVLEENLAAGD